MALREPFAAYNANDNIEVHLVCNLLNDAGIVAMVIEDLSYVGAVSWGGLSAELHKPQVWIERADSDRAKVILDEYESRAIARRKPATGGEPIRVICEECGAASDFPSTQNGTTQDCPHCHAYVDVGNEVSIEGWDEVTGEEETNHES